MNEPTRCVCCDQEAYAVSTAEVGESGNWIRGPFCYDHYEKARRYGRTARRRQCLRGERVEKPDWAEPWQYEAPGTPPEPDTIDTPDWWGGLA